MILLTSPCPALIDEKHCYLDLKFHSGATALSKNLGHTLTVALAPSEEAAAAYGFRKFLRSELPYNVVTCPSLRSGARASPSGPLAEVIAQCKLIYGPSASLGLELLRKNKLVVPIVEHNRRTAADLARLRAPTALRGVARRIKSHQHHRHLARLVSESDSVHCNGYPAFNEMRRRNPRALLYLDSRLQVTAIASKETVTQRCLPSRIQSEGVRTFYSGRLESFKGALDLIRIARLLRDSGVPFTLDIYGDGSLARRLEDGLQRHQLRKHVQLRGYLPYEDLQERARGYDLFLCCHPQGDPSCTYIETMGAGVPIVGYGNCMWESTQADSEAGVVVPVGRPRALADAVRDLWRNPDTLLQMSLAARAFAMEHSFGSEMLKRSESLNGLLQ